VRDCPQRVVLTRPIPRKSSSPYNHWSVVDFVFLTGTHVNVETFKGILDELDPSERKLFSDNIRRLDKRIHQGMTKLTWSSKGNSSLLVAKILNCSRFCCSRGIEGSPSLPLRMVVVLVVFSSAWVLLPLARQGCGLAEFSHFCDQPANIALVSRQFRPSS